MPTITENKYYTSDEVLGFFGSVADSSGAATAKAYRKTIASVSRFLTERGTEYRAMDEADLRDWISNLFVQGFTFKTVSYYLDTLAAMHRKAVRNNVVAEAGAFEVLKREFRAAEKDAPRPVDTLVLQRLRRTETSDYTDEKRLVLDMFMIRVIRGGAGYLETAMLKKDDLPSLPPQARTIAERYVDARRRYVFPLNQSARTSGQIVRSLRQKESVVLQEAGFARSRDVSQLVWAEAALCIGIRPSVVAACANGVRDECLALRFACPSEPERSEKDRAVRDVAEAITGDRIHWYAMRLRPYRKFGEVERRLAQHGQIARQVIDLYYPYEEIFKRLDRKLIRTQRPVIRDVVFFRADFSSITPLFREIGDLAWGYRTDGAYAVIKDEDMRVFQRVIGRFTPDLKPVAGSNRDLRAGRFVRITGGKRAGYVGKIYKVKNSADTCIFSLDLLGFEFLKWEERIESCFVEEITEEQANEYVKALRTECPN